MTNEFKGQGGLNKFVYERRKAMVEEYWQKYQMSNDPEHLAVICKELPFFEHPEVGKEIARLLLKLKKFRQFKLFDDLNFPILTKKFPINFNSDKANS